MQALRPANERGHTRIEWLDSYHSFSFGDYYDPAQMGFGDLRVINDDRVAPGQGFGMHGHRDMEIITVVLEGTLAHTDSLGNGSTIRPGEVQRMSAGTGIRHSEFNPSPSEPVHLLQIWILPDRSGHPPSYEQTAFDPQEFQNRLRLVASPDGREGSVTLHQDARLFMTRLQDGHEVTYQPPANRRTWLQVATGTVAVNGQPLRAGDGLGMTDDTPWRVSGSGQVLIFDLRP